MSIGSFSPCFPELCGHYNERKHYPAITFETSPEKYFESRTQKQQTCRMYIYFATLLVTNDEEFSVCHLHHIVLFK